MTNTNISSRAQIAQLYAQSPIQRQLRNVRAYVLPLRGPAGFRTIPVARFSFEDESGVDVPMLADVWSVNGVTDEETIPVIMQTHHRGRRQWEYYNIWFIRPERRRSPSNPGLRSLGVNPPITGEFIIFRRNGNAARIMDVRHNDHLRMELALIRLVRLLYNRDHQWRGTL
ncbi:hypothetical protein NUW54_g6533 [Trametes sanguinea]|uniref:Uncharacterized protein n=1 Tax=Trametes sanguinea TaxID=158606 RepID=A0ACC1PUY4_9APHY|nr:hypothetical protein NUW54_g6533 [Trametes sanguinea]